MKTIETTAKVGSDRRLVLQLPDDVLPGEHRVVLLIDPAEGQESEPAEQPLIRKGSVLVHTGELTGDPDRVLHELREERMRKLTDGLSE